MAAAVCNCRKLPTAASHCPASKVTPPHQGCETLGRCCPDIGWGAVSLDNQMRCLLRDCLQSTNTISRSWDNMIVFAVCRDSLVNPNQQQIGAGRDSPARIPSYRQPNFSRQPSIGQYQPIQQQLPQHQQPLARSKSNGRGAEAAAASAVTGYCYGRAVQTHAAFLDSMQLFITPRSAAGQLDSSLLTVSWCGCWLLSCYH